MDPWVTTGSSKNRAKLTTPGTISGRPLRTSSHTQHFFFFKYNTNSTTVQITSDKIGIANFSPANTVVIYSGIYRSLPTLCFNLMACMWNPCLAKARVGAPPRRVNHPHKTPSTIIVRNERVNRPQGVKNFPFYVAVAAYMSSSSHTFTLKKCNKVGGNGCSWTVSQYSIVLKRFVEDGCRSVLGTIVQAFLMSKMCFVMIIIMGGRVSEQFYMLCCSRDFRESFLGIFFT